MRTRSLVSVALAAGIAGAHPANADQMLAEVAYPYPVRHYDLASQRQILAMAYMDVPPAADKANAGTAVLLHGKNFCAATWESTIAALTAAGYRVIAPDQIGFCKSSKPAGYQLSLHQLAANTRALLASLGIEKPILIGHSMGGMLAVRYALSFPQDAARLVLVNPIGLENWGAKGVPPRTIDELYEAERKTTADTIKAYQMQTYYGGQWKPEYDLWVAMLASMYRGEGGAEVAWSQALASDMIFTQPVVHELPRLSAPTVLLIG